jgi:hypothetical protein
VRFVFAACLVVAALVALVSVRAERNDRPEPWITPARIMRNGAPSGAGVYLKSGLVLTVAHLTAADAKMGVHIAGLAVPATVVKQGAFEEEDLTLLAVDADKLPARVVEMQLCDALPWPGDPVIVVDADNATRSHIISPQILPEAQRRKFATLIRDVASTGNSGSGVFDPNHKCLLGIMSRKFFSHTATGDKDIAKYFVPAATIRKFMASADAADQQGSPYAIDGMADGVEPHESNR